MDGEPHIACVLLLAAIAVERYMPTARQPSKETARRVAGRCPGCLHDERRVSCRASRTRRACRELVVASLDLLPAVLFLIAAVCFRQAPHERRRQERAPPTCSITLFYRGIAQCRLPRGGSIFPAAFRWPVFLAE